MQIQGKQGLFKFTKKLQQRSKEKKEIKMEILSIEQNLLMDQIKNRKTTLRIIKI